MENKDYYETLGISRGATHDEIRKAYRKLAMKYHPDRNQGDKAAEQKFRQASDAYEVLKDEQKKASYDRMGHSAFTGSGGGAAGAGSGDFQAGFDFSDLFGDFFGDFSQGKSRTQSSKGADLRYDISLSLEEAYKGIDKTINFSSLSKCDSCSGSGGQSGARAITCNICKGTGRMRTQQGFFMVERPCTQCQGIGEIIQNPCNKCSGTGRYKQSRNLKVKIPAGVDDNTKIKISGEGEYGFRGAGQGNLYVCASVTRHNLFSRQGGDLHCTIPLRMTTACIGGSIKVPSIEGKLLDINIPAGTQNNAQFKLKNKGMPYTKSSKYGDMHVKVNVEIPVKINKKQREILEVLEKELTSESNPQSEGFFKKIKNFW